MKHLDLLHILRCNTHSCLYTDSETYLYSPQVPFFVAIDDETQHVVLAIRGTLSLHDAITDLNAQCTSVSNVFISDDLSNECMYFRGSSKLFHPLVIVY